jgi:hypothetical protein
METTVTKKKKIKQGEGDAKDLFSNGAVGYANTVSPGNGGATFFSISADSMEEISKMKNLLEMEEDSDEEDGTVLNSTASR